MSKKIYLLPATETQAKIFCLKNPSVEIGVIGTDVWLNSEIMLGSDIWNLPEISENDKSKLASIVLKDNLIAELLEVLEDKKVYIEFDKITYRDEAYYQIKCNGEKIYSEIMLDITAEYSIETICEITYELLMTII